MKLAWMLLLAVLLCTVGCASLPPIKNHHWAGGLSSATLYRDDGVEAAHLNWSLWGEPAQVCIFESHEPCRYFEKDAQALNWLAHEYASEGKK